MTELNEEQERQVADRDRLVQIALLCGVNEVAMDPRLLTATGAVRTRVIVSAAVGYLLGVGAITVTPPDEIDEWFPVGLPAHLEPDIDDLIAGNRALRDALFPDR